MRRRTEETEKWRTSEVFRARPQRRGKIARSLNRRIVRASRLIVVDSSTVTSPSIARTAPREPSAITATSGLRHACAGQALSKEHGGSRARTRDAAPRRRRSASRRRRGVRGGESGDECSSFCFLRGGRASDLRPAKVGTTKQSGPPICDRVPAETIALCAYAFGAVTLRVLAPTSNRAGKVHHHDGASVALPLVRVALVRVAA